MAERVLVLGAGFGGLNAALKLRRKGYDVVLVDMKEHHEYVPGLINVFRDRVSPGSLSVELERFLSGTGIEFRQEEVEAIDPGKSNVKFRDDQIEYDYLVVALGGEPRTFGMDISEAYSPYTLEEAQELEEDLDEDDSVAVVGSGYVGIEVGAELAEKGHDVSIIDQSTRPMPGSPEEASHLALDYCDRAGINFRGGKKVVEVLESGVRTESGDEIQADRTVWAGGVRPVEAVRESFGESGVEVNPGLCSQEYDNVFALGDCADSGILKTAHNAMNQAGTVARNVDREVLEDYTEGTNPLVVSMGSTGMFLYGDFVLCNRFLRQFKDLVRMRYWTSLRKEKWKTRIT